MWQIHNGHDGASALRGRAVYEQAEALSASIHLGDGITSDDLLSVPVGARLQVQVLNPSNLGMVRTIQLIRESPRFHGTVVVDVTFPIDNLDAVAGGLDPDDPLYEHDNAVTRASWGEGSSMRAALYGAIRAADSIITPHEEWAVPLRAMHSRVQVVADLHDPADTTRFALQLAIAHSSAVRW